MAEERLVESIQIKCWPNSYFNWYEKVSTWLGRVSYRYEIIVRNRNVYVTTVSNVGENPVNQQLRERIKGICLLLNETELSKVEEGEVPFLTSKKVVEAINLFNRLHLINNKGSKPTEWLTFKLFMNGISNSLNGGDPFVVREIEWSGKWFNYTFEYYGRQGERKDSIYFSNSYQQDAVLTLIRAAIMCTIEENGAFGHINFTNVSSLIEKAKKYGIIKIIPDVEYDFLPWSENQRHFQYRRKCLEESN